MAAGEREVLRAVGGIDTGYDEDRMAIADLCLRARQRDFVFKARDASQSLLAILDDILDFSRIEAGRLELEHTEFGLDEVLERVATLVSLTAAEKNLEFVIAVRPDVPARLVGDGLRLSQVLINLAGNAVKFTDAGTVALDVEVDPSRSDRPLLRFAWSLRRGRPLPRFRPE